MLWLAMSFFVVVYFAETVETDVLSTLKIWFGGFFFGKSFNGSKNLLISARWRPFARAADVDSRLRRPISGCLFWKIASLCI